jgi:DNA-directed RNA polymerase
MKIKKKKNQVYGVTFIGAKDQIENRLRETYGEAGTNELSEKVNTHTRMRRRIHV